MTAYRYFQIVAEQFADEIIDETDLIDFSPEVSEKIKEIKKCWEEDD